MTKFDLYPIRKSVNKAEIAHHISISKSRLTQLSSDESTYLRADELCLIALAMDMDSGEVQEQLCGHLKLRNND